MRIKTWAILVVVLLALPTLVWAQGEVGNKTSEWVTISVNPAEIPADGNSTSKITVVALWPEGTEHSGEPAENETVVMTVVNATFAWLTDIGNESNTGTLIRVSADDNGTATALLSGNETGEVTVKADCLSGGWNFTKVTFQEPVAAAATTTPSPAINETSTAAPSPTGATPAINETPTATPSPMGTTPALNETPTATLSPTETTPATPTATPTAKPSVPGFGAVFAIAGLLAVAYLVRRERRRG